MLVISQIAVIIGAAFISEDLALITVALLIRNMQIHWVTGFFGAFLAIFIGDMALWALGRFVGRKALAIGWIARRLPAARVEAASSWFDRNGLAAMIAARFVPGMRLPRYFASGIIGRNVSKVIAWTFIASLIWAPLFVGVIVLIGEPVLMPIQRFLGGGWVSLVAVAVLAYGCFVAAGRLASRDGRRALRVMVGRVHRWEFWPSWLFYLPMTPYFLWLSWRYRGVTTFTAANPGIPAGGVVDESKAQILAQLPKAYVADFALIPQGNVAARLSELEGTIYARGWRFPLFLKPDNGYRGASVKQISSLIEARHYFESHHGPVVAQVAHPGPFEAGVFYYRLPRQSRGHIFSITDKHFSRLMGDGRHTVEELIWMHPRFFMQARVFLQRHRAIRDKILGAGEELPLAVAGNHCQGTMFKDGSHLITPALEARMDEIARHFDGFFFGRFDIRYSDRADFMAGNDITIIELNGVTSESTNLYDPSWSILRAYRTLAATWQLAFTIGSGNREAGHQPTRLTDLLKSLWKHFRAPRLNPLSD